MDSPVTVSWLIPVKNGMPYLPEMLASLEAQTCRDFEVLVWDNGSTDGSIEELERWIPQRLPGTIIRGKPLSLGDSLAGLVDLSKTDLCARLDADDRAMPDRLEIQLAFLKTHPEIALVGGALEFIGENGEYLGRRQIYPCEHEEIVARLLIDNPIGHPSVTFRRQAVLDAGNYADRSPVEDYDLWLRMAPKYRLANLPQVLTCYRIHDRSITQTSIRTSSLRSKADRIFIPNARSLYGWDEGVAEKFRTKRLKWMLPVALNLARYRASVEGSTLWYQLRRPSLIGALSQQTNKRDFASKLTLYILNPGRLPITHYLSKLIGRIADRWSVVFWIRQMLRCWRRSRALMNWINEQESKDSHISRTLFFKGASSPFLKVKTGARVCIERDVTIWIASEEAANPELEIGDDSFIGFQSFLGAYQPVHIGARVLIGAFCYIISANHRYTRRDIAIKDQGFAGAPIKIEDDVWLGTHVVVLPGVTIGQGVIVGAGSVVNRSIPPWEIWGGVPARFLKKRP